MVKRSIGVLLLVLASVCTVTAQSTSALRINEVLTNNVSNYVDPFGNRGAWIEIYNSSAGTVQMAGCYITNDKSNPKKYMISKGDLKTKIGPRQRVLLWADNLTHHGAFHTNFVLEPNKENYIGLFDASGKNLIDEVIVPPLGPDESYGAPVDGSRELKILPHPTPDAANYVENSNPKVDKFAEKYPYFTPYCYTANSPQKFIDINGDSIAVLNLGGLIGHSALLIQNDNGKWSYFSMNGTNVYDKTYGLAGGKPYHDLGEKSFDSPQDFLNSSYNRTANNEKEILDNTVNNYGYKEAYILPTNSTQDNIIETEFRKNAKNGYSLINNQCAQVVQKSLKAAGINTEEEVFRFYDSMISIGQMVKEAPYMPSSTFRTIRHNNPNGKYIQKK